MYFTEAGGWTNGWNSSSFCLLKRTQTSLKFISISGMAGPEGLVRFDFGFGSEQTCRCMMNGSWGSDPKIGQRGIFFFLLYFLFIFFFDMDARDTMAFLLMPHLLLSPSLGGENNMCGKCYKNGFSLRKSSLTFFSICKSRQCLRNMGWKNNCNKEHPLRSHLYSTHPLNTELTRYASISFECQLVHSSRRIDFIGTSLKKNLTFDPTPDGFVKSFNHERHRASETRQGSFEQSGPAEQCWDFQIRTDRRSI